MSRLFATLLVLVCASMSINTADARAQVMLYSSPDCSTAPVGNTYDIDSGNQCYQMPGFSQFQSGSVQCTATNSGFTQVTTLYSDNGCGSMFASGTGSGNNTECTQVVTPSGGFAASVHVNCNSASTASSNIWVTSAVIAASVAGAFMFA